MVDEMKRYGEEQIYDFHCCESLKDDWQRRVALALLPHVDDKHGRNRGLSDIAVWIWNGSNR